ncbi:MAG: Swt1 family HEPN domain-containing protein [Rhodobacteraceae bacterium]|nr:Swt1 family HEPN domain-containing protein [Paracoccaceae bacterium]
MSTRRQSLEAKARVDTGLDALRVALEKYVERPMELRFGSKWRLHVWCAKGGKANQAFDVYSLLRTMIEYWHETFAKDGELRKARSYIYIALNGRNSAAHHTGNMTNREALRYLDAMNVLASAIGGEAQAEEIEALYNEQLRQSGLQILRTHDEHPQEEQANAEELNSFKDAEGTLAAGAAPAVAGTHGPASKAPGTPRRPKHEAVIAAERLAGSANTVAELRAALEQFTHCPFREEANNLVFGDGSQDADVMIVGEAPGAREDELGRPFVGKSGQLLDKMFAEIGLSRFDDDLGPLYISNVVNWRPPGNMTPRQADIDMFKPFIRRHIELVAPRILVLLGNPACEAILGESGITRLRGDWHEFDNISARPSYHPAYLLRNSDLKRESWEDLLAIKQRLRELGNGA